MADTIDFGKVKQGSQPTLTFVWPLPTSPAHTPDDLDGFTITGVMQNIDTGDVTAISSGAVTVTTGATRTCAWEMGATDTGTAGSFLVVLTATDGSTPIKTLNGSLYIESDPSVTAIAGESLEGVPTSDAAWLATSASGGTLGTAAYAASGDFDAAGSAAAVEAALSSHTENENNPHGVTAAQVNAVPENAAILSKSGAYELAAGDEAKIIECNGTFTITCPDGLDTGFQVAVVNIGTGTITIAATTTLQTKDSAVTLPNQYSAATVYHRGSNVWLAFGDLS